MLPVEGDICHVPVHVPIHIPSACSLLSLFLYFPFFSQFFVFSSLFDLPSLWNMNTSFSLIFSIQLSPDFSHCCNTLDSSLSSLYIIFMQPHGSQKTPHSPRTSRRPPEFTRAAWHRAKRGVHNPEGIEISPLYHFAFAGSAPGIVSLCDIHAANPVCPHEQRAKRYCEWNLKGFGSTPN